MYKERYSRKDGENLVDLIVVRHYAKVFADWTKDMEAKEKTYKNNRGLYVYVTSNITKYNAIKYFGTDFESAMKFFLNRCKLKSTRLYVALGIDYEWHNNEDNLKGIGAEDFIVCGDSYPNREDIYRIAVRKVLVGVVKPDFCDQRYLRDRDMVVPLYIGETDRNAIDMWCSEMENWIRADEKHLVKVIREVGLKEYAGSEIYRHG